MPAPSSPYVPLEGTLAARVCAFFLRHPDEELSTKDIAQKFDVPVGSVRNSLQACLTHKLLKLATASWLAGENLRQAAPAPQPAPPMLGAKARRPVARLPSLDLGKLEVRRGVPIPAISYGRAEKGKTKYDAALDKLVEAGASFELPLEYRAAVTKALQTYSQRTGRKFQIRRVSDTHCGVWRTT